VKSARKVIINLNKIRSFKKEPLLRARKTDPIPVFQSKKSFQSGSFDKNSYSSSSSSSSSAQTNHKPVTETENETKQIVSETCNYCKAEGHSLSACEILKAKERRKSAHTNSSGSSGSASNRKI
jgi:hypothetical protein